MLAWVAAQTERIDVGSAIFQIPARTPAMTAMTAATLDTLSGGRFRLGLGVSGPQVSEGWYGVRFDKPLARTREYVEIVRDGDAPRAAGYEGEHWTLPLPDGPGKALKLTVHPVREQIPLYLAAIGPKNLELTGEIADGALPIFLVRRARRGLPRPAAGRPREGRADAWTASTSCPTVPVVDRRRPRAACADPFRAYTALYVGGMGSRQQNFYNQLARRMGYEAEAAEIQDQYLADKQRARPPPYRTSSSTAPRCSGRRSGSPTGWPSSPRRGHHAQRLAVRATVEDRIASLRVLVDAVERAGLA